MKQIITLIALTVLLAGCMTTPEGKRVPDPAAIESISKSAAALGTASMLIYKPESRPAFEKAEASLQALLAAGSGNVLDLKRILTELPLGSRLESGKGAIILENGIIIIDLARSQLARLDENQNYSRLVEPIAKGLADGIGQALAAEAN